jgi:outer membrane receptor protein involved in Fe transport
MHGSSRRFLFITSAASVLGAALSPGAALAADANAASGGSATGLEEVVVTATRQNETVNRVPLSITAQTQRNMDQQGIRQIADLQGAVPALQVTQSTSGVAYPTIRGISGTGASTAATTGFYLDDIPLQRRNAAGIGLGNGSPLPPLFDLDRVEVLRGPQGTLFGGSSQGGTIRYIQPAPSLTRYSSYARAEASKTKYGGTNYEGGVAVGGPIVADKLGFRANMFYRKQAGWVDIVDPITAQTRFKNANEGSSRSARLAVTWAPTDRSRVTMSYFSSRETQDTNNFAGTYTQPINGAIVEPTVCFNTANLAAAPAAQRQNPIPLRVNGGGTGGVNPSDTSSPYLNAAQCGAATAAGQATFTRPGATYGPYPNLGPGAIVAAGLAPSTTNIQLASLTVDYEFEHMNVRSITSYIDDQTKADQLHTTLVSQRNTNSQFNGITLPQGPNFSASCRDACQAAQRFTAQNRRYGIVQEVRFSSAGDARPFSWVAGVYYSNLQVKQEYLSLSNGQEGFALYGLSSGQRFGLNQLPLYPGGPPELFDHKDNQLKDVEIAAYGEANYWVTDKLRLTAGIRLSRVDFSFRQRFFGPINGFLDPTFPNGGLAAGTVTEDPVTPRFTAQYQLTENNMLYTTASKGFRAGGVNTLLAPGVCQQAFDFYGLVNADIPTTFASDTVWNYEAGGKFRVLNNRVQINADVYRIDWKDPQFTVALPLGCGGVPFITNVGQARSEGVEFEAQARLFRGLSANVAFGYGDARYTEDAVPVLKVPTLVVARKDQKFTTPPWTLQVGARYDAQIATNIRGYVRADWRYIRGYKGTAAQTPGVAAYAPDALFPNVQRTNMRIGVEYGDFDINVFANNLFDSNKGNRTGGRSACAVATGAACTTFGGYNPYFTVTPVNVPRQIGVQIAYRH